jgi:hypothetical protein
MPLTWSPEDLEVVRRVGEATEHVGLLFELVEIDPDDWAIYDRFWRGVMSELRASNPGLTPDMVTQEVASRVALRPSRFERDPVI